MGASCGAPESTNVTGHWSRRAGVSDSPGELSAVPRRHEDCPRVPAGWFLKRQRRVTNVERAMVLSAIILTLATAARAQSGRTSSENIISIGNTHSCPACTIRLSRAAIFGDTAGPGLLPTRPGVIARDRRGHVFMSFSRLDIMVFDSVGRFLARFAAPGDGPGESRLVDGILPIEGDSVLVFDAGLRRVSLFGPALEFVRSWRRSAAKVDAALRTKDGLTVLAAQVNTPASAGFPLHFVQDTNSTPRSFGSFRPELRPEFPDLSRRRLARSQVNGFWSARMLEYLLEQWDSAGRPLAAIARTAPWFVASTKGPVYVTPTQPPPSVLLGLFEDSRRLLWTVVGRARANWQRGLGAKRQSQSGVDYYEIRDIGEVNESWIEVLDPRARTLVTATTTYPLRIDWVVGDLLASYEEDDATGVARVTLWRTGLESRSDHLMRPGGDA